MRFISKIFIFAVMFNSLTGSANTPGELKPYDTFDFGDIQEGDRPTHVFSFKNETETIMQIIKVRVPCGCAETKVEKAELNPGIKTKFDIKLDSKGRRGKIKKALYLLTNNKKVPMVKYIVTANIKPKPAPVCSAPSVVKAGKMKPNETKEVSFEIKNNGVLDLIVDKKVIATSVKLKTGFPVTIPPGEKQTIEIAVTTPSYEGKFRDNLLFKTNDNAKSDLWILVTADVTK